VQGTPRYTMDINDKLTAVGHLEIIKVYEDGTEELLFEDQNVICGGLGQSIAEWMTKEVCGPNQQRIDDCPLVYLPGEVSNT